MANRYYQQFPKSLIKEVVSVFANIPIGASGAVQTLNQSKNMGIKSVTRTSAGLYVITLGSSPQNSVDKYNSLLMVSSQILFNGVSAVRSMNVVSEAVISSGQIVIQCSSGGSAVDPDSGSIIMLEIKLKNSSVI